jgi:periplasmic protein CpxP/Spy
MKKIIILLAACLSLNTAINAQDMQKESDKKEMGKGKGRGKDKKHEWSPEQRAQKGAEWAEKALGLNADQKAKWQAAALTRMQANGPLREKMKATEDKAERQKIREEIKANTTNFDTTVSGILTPEQKTKWEEIKKKKMEEHKMKKGKEGEEHEMKDVDQG